MVARTAVAILLLLSLAGVLWWANGMAGSGTAQVGDHWVAVIGPSQDVVNGTVHARGTPLAVVQALAGQRGFAVDVEERPLVGRGCTADYVIGIAGARETTTGGWNYYTRMAGEEWAWRSVGASCYALKTGEQVEWCWVESDVCRHHVP